MVALELGVGRVVGRDEGAVERALHTAVELAPEVRVAFPDLRQRKRRAS